MPRGPGLNRNLLYASGGDISSLTLTLTLATPPADLCTVIYDCGVTALVAGNTVSLAIKQGSAFLAIDSTVSNDPDVGQIRMALSDTSIPHTPPWLAWGAPGVALSVVLIVLTPLTSGTIFAVSEEVPVN